MKKTDANAILDCSLELFRDKGYRGTSMADIGSATGLLKGSIYHYFDSKEHILVASLSRLSIFFKDQVFAIAYEDSMPASVRLNVMLKAIESYFNEHKACTMAHLALENISQIPEAEHLLRTFFKEWHNALAYVFAEKYDQDEAGRLAEDAICSIEGTVIWLKLYGDSHPLTRVCAQIMSFL